MGWISYFRKELSSKIMSSVSHNQRCRQVYAPSSYRLNDFLPFWSCDLSPPYEKTITENCEDTNC